MFSKSGFTVCVMCVCMCVCVRARVKERDRNTQIMHPDRNLKSQVIKVIPSGGVSVFPYVIPLWGVNIDLCY